MLTLSPIFVPLLVVSILLYVLGIVSLATYRSKPRDLPKPDTPKPPLNYKRTADSEKSCVTCRDIRTPAGSHPCVKACYTSSRRPNWTPRKPVVVDPTPEAPKVEPLEDRCPQH